MSGNPPPQGETAATLSVPTQQQRIYWMLLHQTFQVLCRYLVSPNQDLDRGFTSTASARNSDWCNKYIQNRTGFQPQKVTIRVHLIQVCTACGYHSSHCFECDEAGETGQVFDKEIWVIDVKWYDLSRVAFEMLGHGGDILGDVWPDRWVTWDWRSCNWPNSGMRRKENILQFL